MTDKLVIANRQALKTKFGNSGVQAIEGAIARLIAADKPRGIDTRLIYLDDAAAMKKNKGAAVKNSQNEKQNKNAVDALYAALKPDYIVILGGPDIVPHLTLNNPTPADDDTEVPSDLPYASDTPFIKRDAAAYLAVTRVVGRIPGIVGVTDPAFLIQQVDNAAAFEPRKRDDYLSHFSISAEVWRNSTETSVKNIFGNQNVQLCPTMGSPEVGNLLAPLLHFINCHGAPVDAQFYGQQGSTFPIAMSSDDVALGAKKDAIVAAECCYGAQLFDVSETSSLMPISLSYLGAGGIGFVGSTTIAYGPAKGNGAADLLTQYFLIEILAGASLGRAFLQARQKFIQTQRLADPVNLKTIAQFILLGDPSVHPCPAEPAAVPGTPIAKTMLTSAGDPAARADRRMELIALGKATALASAFLGKRIVRPRKTLENLVREIAGEKHFRIDSLAAFEVSGGPIYREAMKLQEATAKVFVLASNLADGAKAIAKSGGAAQKEVTEGARGVTLMRILVAHAHDDRIVQVAEYVSR